MNFLVIKKKTILAFFVFGLALVSVWVSSTMLSSTDVPAMGGGNEVREIHMITGEFKSTTEDGKEIESYRWDPGTIFVEKGERVNLIIYGVNGKEHPFIIEGTDVEGVVRKGEETIVPLQFKEKGVYRLICPMHADKDSDGPMIAYIVVN
ncbi:plastocyanin [Evansella vedderi]|uniref:Plastocyanin n=1 Tax=Evansella vedderi TaxID=38282 RepID=A0ABT9ZS21_9BACI|nr:cupredoxin domain-containing protein [Evansella vedderi]MDQ0254027.1 plastocyanin [Evansella vedderi]